MSEMMNGNKTRGEKLISHVSKKDNLNYLTKQDTQTIIDNQGRWRWHQHCAQILTKNKVLSEQDVLKGHGIKI